MADVQPEHGTALACGCTVCPDHSRARRIRSQARLAEGRTRNHLSGRNGFKEFTCNSCGVSEEMVWDRSEQMLQLDHIIPISRGGDNALENLQLLCPHCHRAKTAKENAR